MPTKSSKNTSKEPTSKTGSKTKAKTEVAPAVNGEAVAGTEVTQTVSHLFGEAVWLLTQSKIHRHLSVADIEWLIMPPILLGQGRIFRAGTQALGLALWAWLDEEAEEKLQTTGKLGPNEWRAGTDALRKLMAHNAEKAKAEKEGNAVASLQIDPPQGNLWLVDLVCPFATNENKLVEACIADLMNGPLKGQKIKVQKTDPKTGEKSVIKLGGKG
jgi:cytolysin-activating lysine-acyltransferase